MSKVTLVWAAPQADQLVASMARVSNPSNQSNPKISGLLSFCMREGHVSPFEMVSVCLEIETTRDIGRQLLRHRSFSFQEFSQRYADATLLTKAPLRECRLQDTTNRQSSIDLDHMDPRSVWWDDAQKRVEAHSLHFYEEALALGIAKEQARALLPEGLTSSRMYMNGTLRSWIHYLQSRLDKSTQKEHRVLAEQALTILRTVAPITMEAFFPEEKLNEATLPPCPSNNP